MILRKRTNSVKLLIGIFTLYSMCFVPVASAAEIIISGNGSESTSQVTTQSNTNTEIQQTNTANTSNTVNSEAKTGENSASGNTGGDVNIETGDASSQVSIENSGNLSTVSNNNCCVEGGDSLTISENGSGSDNTINHNLASTTTVNVEQSARITNNIVGYVNTGNNTASNNTGGNITISTGNVNARERIVNGPINYSQISLGAANSNIIAFIKDNGSDTRNIINNDFSSTQNINVNNYSILDNYSRWYLSTGGNEADDNAGGDITIETGDIDFVSLIKNLLNKSVVEIECCEIFEDSEDPDEEEENGEPEKDNDKKDKDKKEDEENENKIPAGDELKAGGPGILGLSDTSGGGFGNLILWFGLVLSAGGSKMLYGEFSKVFRKKG